MWLPVALGAALVLLLQTSLGSWVLATAGVAPRTAPFLELYFADPVDHPSAVAPNTVVPVSFVLSSNGNTFADVDWYIETIEDAGGTKRVASGTTTVPEGESRTVDADVAVPCHASTGQDSRTQVRVSVDDPPESILFWVTCDSAAT